MRHCIALHICFLVMFMYFLYVPLLHYNITHYTQYNTVLLQNVSAFHHYWIYLNITITLHGTLSLQCVLYVCFSYIDISHYHLFCLLSIATASYVPDVYADMPVLDQQNHQQCNHNRRYFL